MDWEEHKRLAQSSREVIVVPWLERALSDAIGPCLDIGCGSADITAHLASHLDISLIGVDKLFSDSTRIERESCRLHLVAADITKNGLLETGVTFSSAFSNCCFCHLDDEQFVTVLADLFNATPD